MTRPDQGTFSWLRIRIFYSFELSYLLTLSQWGFAEASQNFLMFSICLSSVSGSKPNRSTLIEYQFQLVADNVPIKVGSDYNIPVFYAPDPQIVPKRQVFMRIPITQDMQNLYCTSLYLLQHRRLTCFRGSPAGFASIRKVNNITNNLKELK